MLLGGILTQSLGWQWVLFVNVPIGIAAAALSPMLLRESRREGVERNFDVAGAITSTAGLVLLVYAVVKAIDNGWGSTTTIVLLALAALLLITFAVVETRARQPLVPFRVFRIGSIAGANVDRPAHGRGAVLDVLLHLAVHAADPRLRRAGGGLAYLPLAGSIVVAAGVASQLPIAWARARCSSAAWCSWPSAWSGSRRSRSAAATLADVLGPSLLAGWGLGLAFVPVTIASQGGIAERDAGLASGLINTAQQVGGALGLAVLVTVANSTTNSAHDRGPWRPRGVAAALTDGFGRAFLVGAGIAVAGVL